MIFFSSCTFIVFFQIGAFFSASISSDEGDLMHTLSLRSPALGRGEGSRPSSVWTASYKCSFFLAEHLKLAMVLRGFRDTCHRVWKSVGLWLDWVIFSVLG